jgi:anti-sigma regulatory factor (Ser/Thr protein kinase)
MDLALGNAPEDDDIVVISARPEWISLRLKCKMATAERLTLFIRGLEMSLKAEERDMIAAVFRELLVNAIEHGGHSDPQLEVNLSYIRTSRSIIYYLRDPGPGFSIDAIPHAAVGNPDDPVRHVEIREAQGMRAGGFGILLSRNFADELIYSEKGNEVVFIKYLNHE